MIVVCSRCSSQVHHHDTRQRVEAWSKPWKGGSLTGVKLLEKLPEYLCDPCVRELEHARREIPGQQGML